MVTSVNKILKIIDQLAPFSTQDTWDNSGLIVGNSNKEVDRVLFALDLTDEVIDEAIDESIDLIITHHPPIFFPIKAVTTDQRTGKMIIKLIQNNINVIAAHTNLDKSFKYGINRFLGDAYQLQDMVCLVPETEGTCYGVVGILSMALSFDAFVNLTKEIFAQDFIKISNNRASEQIKTIKKIAICSGASADYIEFAKKALVDVFITSDLKHHESQSVEDHPLILMDVGHFESENVYLARFKELIDEQINLKNYDVFTKITETEKPQFRFL